LDGTVRREILDLLAAEQQRSGLALLFISHDLSVVKRISHRVMVLYMGRVCEVADGARLFRRPRHPYTRALLDSVPSPDPAVPAGAAEIRGEVASLAAPPPGCVFHPRCRYAVAECRRAVPLLEGEPPQRAACHRAAELDLTVLPAAAAARR
ncbi:MAG TPA: ABC transporter ATP-binding protein, partial [Woeseiaceae bacterium]|nr:ABC transporter ATP-binding protein [Woeseiaceae bacterium]